MLKFNEKSAFEKPKRYQRNAIKKLISDFLQRDKENFENFTKEEATLVNNL